MKIWVPVVFVGFAGLVSVAELSFGACGHPYKKTYPYQLPIGSSRASVLLQNEFRVEYDCESVLAQNNAQASAGLFSTNVDLLTAQASLSSPKQGDASAQASLSVLGFEVSQGAYDLSELVDVTLRPGMDLDVSGQITVQVGPVPVPVKYGIEGQSALHIQGGIQGVGVELNLVPDVQSQAYVQAGVDAAVARVEILGDMTMVNDRLENKVRVSLEDQDQLAMRVGLVSDNTLEALNGKVDLYASAQIGKQNREFSKQLLSWPGFRRNDRILANSAKIPLN